MKNNNVAQQESHTVAMLQKRMKDYIAKREEQTGRTNPMFTNTNYHGQGDGPIKTSEEAYEKLYLGSITSARAIQAKEKNRM
ncbi:hypothetical protein GCM10020331_060860 [Ectobacillus funiculus]